MIARILLFSGCLLALATCEIPIGRDGQYGAFVVGYRLPDPTEMSTEGFAK